MPLPALIAAAPREMITMAERRFPVQGATLVASQRPEHRQLSADPGPSRPRLGTGRLGNGDSSSGREFRRLRVCCQQFRKARGIAARHAAFGGYAVDPGIWLRAAAKRAALPAMSSR